MREKVSICPSWHGYDYKKQATVEFILRKKNREKRPKAAYVVSQCFKKTGKDMQCKLLSCWSTKVSQKGMRVGSEDIHDAQCCMHSMHAVRRKKPGWIIYTCHPPPFFWCQNYKAMQKVWLYELKFRNSELQSFTIRMKAKLNSEPSIQLAEHSNITETEYFMVHWFSVYLTEK